MKFSYSRVSSFSQCPYKWYLHYVKELSTIPETNPDNALYLGLALHKGIETGSVDEGINEYKSHFNIITDENINYIIQLEYQIPRVIELLPEGGEHELSINTDEFVGFIDYIHGDTLYDFKFSNNIDNYLKSPQLSIYKYYLKKVRPDIEINHLKYVFVPKIQIRQKKTETIQQFRLRLMENLEQSKITITDVKYDKDSIAQFQQCCQHLKTVDEFPKNPTKLCGWCEHEPFCKRGEDWIYLDKNEFSQ